MRTRALRTPRSLAAAAAACGAVAALALTTRLAESGVADQTGAMLLAASLIGLGGVVVLRRRLARS